MYPTKVEVPIGVKEVMGMTSGEMPSEYDLLHEFNCLNASASFGEATTTARVPAAPSHSHEGDPTSHDYPPGEGRPGLITGPGMKLRSGSYCCAQVMSPNGSRPVPVGTSGMSTGTQS